MKRIEYRVNYADGSSRIVSVWARDINSGLMKAASEERGMLARLSLASRPELNGIEFWQVRDSNARCA